MKPDYDIIIIGAGIQGAAIARAASYEGYRVCVLEKNHAAGLATSSSSSKLIHGGLRYLESFQFKLVRECLNERATLLKTASQLVKLMPFYIPVYKNNKRPAWLIHLGLFLYRLLGGGPFKRLKPDQWNNLDGLEKRGLKAVFQYVDGVTNDQQLTRAVLDHAVKLGAEFKPNCEVSSCQIKQNAKVNLSNGISFTAKVLVNASGPWINRVLATCQPPQSISAIDLVQGSHIIIPRQLSQGIYYIEANDQRVIFAIPWQDHCLVGTTETIFTAAIETLSPHTEEIDYLLQTWNRYFNDSLQTPDVLEAFAGLRVLPQSQGSAFSRPRDVQIICDNPQQPRLISLYGGKLTAHRATAETVMQQIRKSLGGQPIKDTSLLPLPSNS